MRVQRAQQDHATLFFVHGHQGTTGSDRYGRLARLPVRYFWRPFQRLTGYSATTPASRYDLRETHDRAMFEWARGRGPGVVLIAGHTHRPVFAGSTPDPPPTRPIAHLQAALTEAQSRDDIDAASAVRVELEYALAAQRRPVESITVEPPCYFNTGCCSYPDGDVTGVELANGEIRLVRWPTNLRELQSESGGSIEPDRRILARANLADILDVVSSPPRHARFEKHLITPEPA